MMYDSAAVELTGALVCFSTFTFLQEEKGTEKKITCYTINNNLHMQYSGKCQVYKAA